MLQANYKTLKIYTYIYISAGISGITKEKLISNIRGWFVL